MMRPVRLAVLLVALPSALAMAEDVWMVKRSDVVGCRDREALVALEQAKAEGRSSAAVPEGCFALYSGERLLGSAAVGVGFSDIVEVQRGDGSVVFVPDAALVSDPGIGSVTEDRD